MVTKYVPRTAFDSRARNSESSTSSRWGGVSSALMVMTRRDRGLGSIQPWILSSVICLVTEYLRGTEGEQTMETGSGNLRVPANLSIGIMPERDVNSTFVAFQPAPSPSIVDVRRMHADRSHANTTDCFHL